jgi:hypothetical protein
MSPLRRAASLSIAGALALLALMLPRQVSASDSPAITISVEAAPVFTLSGRYKGLYGATAGPAISLLFFREPQGPPAFMWGFDFAPRYGDGGIQLPWGFHTLWRADTGVYLGFRAGPALRVAFTDKATTFQLGLDAGPEIVVVPQPSMRVSLRLDYQLTSPDLEGQSIGFATHALAIRVGLGFGTKIERSMLITN